MNEQTLTTGIPNRLGHARVGVLWATADCMSLLISDDGGSRDPLRVSIGGSFEAGGSTWTVVAITVPDESSEDARRVRSIPVARLRRTR